MHLVKIRLKETRFVDFSGRKRGCGLCREVMLSPQLVWPLLASQSVNYLFDHNHTCVLLNISALRVQCGIQAFAKSKRPECTRLHLTELQFQNFCQGACPRAPYKVAPLALRIGAIVPILPLYYIFGPPLSQNPPSAPETCC